MAAAAARNPEPPALHPWAERNEHWIAATKKAQPFRARRAQRADPLILCGHGVSLQVQKGTLVVRNGLTHYPQERETHRFFRGALDLPPRIIMLDGSGSLSFDVLTWLSEQKVALFRINYRGDLVSAVQGGAFGLDPVKVDWQVRTRADPELRIAFSCDLTVTKLRNSVTTLLSAVPNCRARDVAVDTAEKVIAKLGRRAVRSIPELMLTEARAAAAYFNAWRAIPIRWKARGRNPIPDAWKSPDTRRSDAYRLHSTNRHAHHPVNAMVNYAYAVLHSAVQTETLSEGYDPSRGVMHESRPDSRAWVLDLIEPRRPEVDAAVLKLIHANTFSGADFTVTADGVCRLSPQLARRVAGLV